MFDSLVFYNHFGAGDLFESREFVREIMTIIPAENYYYAHGKHPSMFKDIENLQYTPITELMPADKDVVYYGESLYINTWIGRDSRYVLPNIGCIIDESYRMFNDILTKIGFPNLSKNYLEYLPTIDFSYFNTKHIDEFLEQCKGVSKILICNGVVNSNQAYNFSFTEIIEEIAKYYDGSLFIVTEPFYTDTNNIVSATGIIKNDIPFDLNEISYLAKGCDVVIGRKSGPFVFAHTKEFWHDKTKRSLSFTYGMDASHFVRGNILPLHKYWSPAIETQDVVNVIKEMLG